VKGWLLDTNVVSEAMTLRPDVGVVRWLGVTNEALQYLSVLSIGEIRRGLSALPHSKRRSALENWLRHDIRERFHDRILPVTVTVADRWGELDARANQMGRPLQTADGLIAATALEHGLTLVTRNVRDFERLGVDVFNPWESE